MQKVATYSLTRRCLTAQEGFAFVAQLEKQIESWLIRKGASPSNVKAKESSIDYGDGRVATLTRSETKASAGLLAQIELTEPSREGAQFRTTICFGSDSNEVVVHVLVEVGHSSGLIAPVRFELYSPRIVQDIVNIDDNWKCGTTSISTSAHFAKGRDGGAELALAIRSPNRTIPIVVVSEDTGFLVHPEIDAELAADLTALATVVRIDVEASWELTRQLSQQWSCYNGAIRLYWPHAFEGTDHFSHPVWTAGRLMENAYNTRDAAKKLKALLRHRLMQVSTFSVRRPIVCDKIPADARREEFQRQLQQAKSLEDFQKLADDYAKSNDKLELENQLLRDEKNELSEQLAAVTKNLLLIRPNDSKSPEFATDQSIAAEDEVPPETVAQAVAIARQDLNDDLSFGDDVDRGISELAPNAGPPEKILKYLRALAKVAAEKRNDKLTKDIILSLKDEGTNCSIESNTIRKNKASQSKRTWNNGDGEDCYFEKHMKPSDGTARNRCARIYFDWCDKRKKIVVGWVGPHPE